jgi:hypothetical protein
MEDNRMTYLNQLLNNLGISSSIEHIFNRATRAVLLDKELYKEVETDPSLDREALLIVVLASLAGGIAAFITSAFRQRFFIALLGLIVSTLIGVASYYIWAYITQFIAKNLYENETDIGELLRVLGYASTPRLISLVGFIPCFGPVLSFAGWIWALIASFIGIREALDQDTTETVVTVFLGWLTIMILSGIVTNLLGIGAIGLGPILNRLGLY